MQDFTYVISIDWFSRSEKQQQRLSSITSLIIHLVNIRPTLGHFYFIRLQLLVWLCLCVTERNTDCVGRISVFKWLTTQHVIVGIVCYGVDVGRGLGAAFAFVGSNYRGGVDGQPFVRVHCHTEEPRVCLWKEAEHYELQYNCRCIPSDTNMCHTIMMGSLTVCSSPIV